MTDEEILERLRPLIVEVTRVEPERIALDSVLMGDLGAQSLDLLDLSFLIEERFGIRLEADEFTSQAQGHLSGGIYEDQGLITDEGLAALRKLLPEVAPEKLTGPMRRTEIPAVLTVGVFVHLIARKLAAKETQIHA